MNAALRCRCGRIQGRVDPRASYGRAVCYCKDCQAFARFLGRADEVLNRAGGSDIVPTAPASVQFTTGIEHLACMSLSSRGLLRWYASCCRTPIANTPRTRNMAYAGLLRNCLADPDDDVDRAFGPATLALNTGSATGEVRATPVATSILLAKLIPRLVAARLLGQYRDNPFFDRASGAPIKSAQVLTVAERHALDAGGQGAASR